MATSVVTADAAQGFAQNALSARIALAAQKGEISALDRVALGNALTAIKGNFVSSIADGKERLSPYEMKTRIEDLIDAQIAGGTLSQSQAEQLRGFYSASPPSDQKNSNGPDEPPAVTAPPLVVTAPSPEAKAATSSDAGAGPDDELEAMSQFLNLLREKMGASRSGYGSAGAPFPLRRSPLVVDTLA